MNWPELDKSVNKFAKMVVKLSRGNLTKERANASKTLYGSIGYRFKDNVLRFFMERYGTFLDKGVSGTGKLWLSKSKSMPVAYNKSEASPEFRFKPNKKAIGGSLKNWLRIRGIPIKAEFPIRRSIHAKGIRPRRFFTNAFNGQMKKFNDDIGNAVSSDINKQINTILKN